MGPLRKISGDIEKVSKGHKTIRWNALEEFDSFVEDNVIFEVRPTKTLAVSQSTLKPSSHPTFQFELGVGGGYYYQSRAVRTNGVPALELSANIGCLLNNNHYLAAGATFPCFSNYGLVYRPLVGLTYRYYPNWKEGIFFGIDGGYYIDEEKPFAQAQIGYSFYKWLHIRANLGYPCSSATMCFNIANMFY